MVRQSLLQSNYFLRLSKNMSDNHFYQDMQISSLSTKNSIKQNNTVGTLGSFQNDISIISNRFQFPEISAVVSYNKKKKRGEPGDNCIAKSK